MTKETPDTCELLPDMIEDYMSMVNRMMQDFGNNKQFMALKDSKLQANIIDHAITPIYYYDKDWRKDHDIASKGQIHYLLALIKDSTHTIEELVNHQNTLYDKKIETLTDIPIAGVRTAIDQLLKERSDKDEV